MSLEALKARHRLAWGLDVESYVRLTAPELAPVAEQVVEAADPPWEGSVLDVGTGPGTAAFAAARRVGPAGRVVGVDLAQPMVAYAERTAQAQHLTQVTFQEADAEDLGDFEDASFDALVSNFGAIFGPRPARFVAEAGRVLKPGGTLALSVWRREGVVAETLDFLSSVLPTPPPEAARPESWGEPGAAEDRLAPGFDAIRRTDTVVVC